MENTPKFEEMMQQYYPNLVTRLLYKSTYHIEMLEDVRLEMIQRMVESGCGLKSVIPKRSLEDFFIKMTEK